MNLRLIQMTRRMKNAAWILCIWMGMTDLCAQIGSHYYHAEKFSIEEGLGHTVIGDLQPDANGFLWIYTIGHLQLFDGMNFINMNHLLHEDPLHGRFNFVYTDEIFFITRNRLYKLNTVDYSADKMRSLELPGTQSQYLTYHFLYENKTHLFILSVNDSVYYVNKQTLLIDDALLLPHKAHGYMIHNDINLRAIVPGQIEYVSEDNFLYTIDLKSKKVIAQQDLVEVYDIVKVSKDTFVTVDAENLNVYTPSGQVRVKKPDAAVNFTGDHLIISNDNKLLLALSNTAYEFDLTTNKFSARIKEIGNNRLADLKVRMMEIDIYGNIFFSTFNKGLVKLHPRYPGFSFIGSNELDKNFVKSISGSDQNNLILMGTLEDGLYVFDTSGQLKNRFLKFPDGTTHSNIRGILKMTETDYIIMGDAFYHFTVHGDQYQFKKINEFPQAWVAYYNQPLEIPEKNKYYLSVWDGLAEFKLTDKLESRFYELHPLDGAYAVTRFNDGFVSAKDAVVKQFGSDLKEPIHTWPIPDYGYMRCIIQNSPNSILAGTDLGLYHIPIEGEKLQPRKLYDKLVYAILPGDAKDEFWFSTDYGLFELKPDGRLTNYSREIGLQENEFNTNCAYKSSTGKLYFGGINGITSFYPADVTEDPDIIQSYISSFSVNKEVVARYLREEPEIKFVLSPKQNNIGIDLLARGNKSPLSYNYQYLMKGLNSGWVDMKRNSHLNFHLKSGTYTFYYHIADGFNPGVKPSEAISIRILQPVYYRWWFITYIILFLIGIAMYMASQKRKRVVMKIRYENKLMQKLQNERMRISRELHDNIGAQMATVKRNINFLISNNEVLEPTQVLNKMKDLEGISTQINQELRDTIWATQHEHISVFNFIARLKNYIFQTLGPESAIRVHYVENCDKEVILGPFLALNLHRICQEAINNAIKHSGATEIRICFEGKGEHFKVTVIDNGRGFDMGNIHEGYGLKNIKHRAEMIGAELNLISNHGTGTTLEIDIRQLETSNNTRDT